MLITEEEESQHKLKDVCMHACNTTYTAENDT
jgi:hypothetical protein